MSISPRTASHPSGLHIEFHPEPHAYLVNGDKLTSVTTLIKKWFPQFDAEAIAKKKVEREGGNYEVLMQQWAQKGEEAASFGTKVHLMVDTILREKNNRAADTLAESARERAYLAAAKEAIARIGRGYEFVESEKIIFSIERKVAGTIDLLLRSKATGEYVVCDWKTNREIKYSSFRDEMGSGPCARLANCNFVHYSLQTSTYAVLLGEEGYISPTSGVRGVLLHLSEKAGGVTCDYVKTQDLTLESQRILAP